MNGTHHPGYQYYEYTNADFRVTFFHWPGPNGPKKRVLVSDRKSGIWCELPRQEWKELVKKYGARIASEHVTRDTSWRW